MLIYHIFLIKKKKNLWNFIITRIIYSTFKRLQRWGKKNLSNLDVCCRKIILTKQYFPRFLVIVYSKKFSRLRSRMHYTDGLKYLISNAQTATSSIHIVFHSRPCTRNKNEPSRIWNVTLNKYRFSPRKIRLEIRLILKTWRNSINKGLYV